MVRCHLIKRLLESSEDLRASSATAASVTTSLTSEYHLAA
jgi:hypothetical protein